MAHSVETMLDQQTQQCIKDCNDCQSGCETMVVHCMQMGGEHAQPEHLRLIMDCGDICDTASRYLARQSEFVNGICQVCADVCDKCGESCEQFEDDDMMLSHAELCRRTAQSCRSMAR